jgi:hypothetical protein
MSTEQFLQVRWRLVCVQQTAVDQPSKLQQSLLVCALLQAGYAVVFLTRTGSIQPFTQDLPLTETVPLLQSMLSVQHSSSSASGARGSYALQEPAAGRVAGILQKVEEVHQSQLLLTVPFTTIFEYLQVGPWVALGQGAMGTQSLDVSQLSLRV